MKWRGLRELYYLKRKEIFKRLQEFRKLWLSGSDEEIFRELSFCILTPQSKAKVCWEAIVRLKENDLLLKGDAMEIEKELLGVRFKNRKAGYIVSARRFFMNKGRVSMKALLKQFNDVNKCREWLVKNIKGIGYKEASHFLRNIGFASEIAILDRHILRNLRQSGIIEQIPKSMSRSKYMEIEKKMKEFAREINIPLSHLDLLLWYKETGEVFK